MPTLLVSDASILEGNAGTANMNFTVTLLRASSAAMVNYATADGTATAPSDYSATSSTVNVPANGTATIAVSVNGDTAVEQNETFLVNLTSPVGAVIADGQAIGTIFSDDCGSAPLGMTDWYKGEGNANDAVGNNNGTLENGATFDVGNTGQAFAFDGINDSVLTPTINLGSAYSIELWIFPARTNGGYENLVANGWTSAANFGALYNHNGNLEYWQGSTQRALASAPLPVNTWTHVAVTYDGAVNRLYVNGVASGVPSVTHTETFTNPVRFGYSAINLDQYFQGRLDEITFYNRTLLDTEIQSIYDHGGGGKCGSSGNNWTGALSSDWHTAGNWSPSVVPTAVADVIIPAAGVTNEPVIGSADVTISSLNVAANRTLTVNTGRNLTVSNDLINNAVLAGAGTINAQGSVTSNSGTISVTSFNFSRSGAQALSGSGSFSSDTASVVSGSTLTLGSNYQFSSLVIQSGATLDITSRVLSVSGSLTNGGTLTITNSTVVANGSSPQTLTNANYDNLTANNPTGVILGGNATVSKTLTLTSDLDTGAFVLSMPWLTEVSAGNGDVIGNVKVTGLAFGSPSTYGNPFNQISFFGGTLPTDVTVNLVKAKPSGAIGFPNAVNRTYTITPNGGSGYTATLRLHYLDSELNGNSEGQLNLWRYNGVSWQKVPATAFNVTDNWVESNVVTTFSPWTFNSTVPTAASATISGVVTSTSGMPLGGVLLELTGGPSVRTVVTNAAGAYSFANLDPQDFYTLTPLLVNYRFTPASRSFSLPGNKTDAGFTAEPAAIVANPLDTPEFFVRQQYLDFLGREPDQAGFEYWSSALNGCGNDQDCNKRKRVDVSKAFFMELEFQQTGAYVYRLYRAAYGNNQPLPNSDNTNQTEARKLPSYRAFAQDRARVVGGADLAQGQLGIANAFSQRSEFFLRYPATQDGPAFVDAVLGTIKNDTGADLASQRATLINLFNSGGRGAVLYRLADDNLTTNPINNRAFIDAEYNRAFVFTQYAGYLRRDSDIGGFLFWLAQVNSNPPQTVSKQHAMVCAFITSAEYQLRFSSIVSHTNAECSQ